MEGGSTWYAAVSDDEELGVAARVGEARHGDVDQTSASAGALAVQQELDVDVAVPRERHVALGGHVRVVAAVARAVERQQNVAEAVVADARTLARDLQLAVETCVCGLHGVIVICKANQHPLTATASIHYYVETAQSPEMHHHKTVFSILFMEMKHSGAFRLLSGPHAVTQGSVLFKMDKNHFNKFLS